MSKTVCRICLRSGFERIKDIDERLVDFHDELCDYNVFQNAAFKFCSVCEYQLRKFYNFRQKCRRTHMVLKSYNQDKKNHGNLQELMPRPSIGFSTARDRQQVFDRDLKTYTISQNLVGYHNLVEYSLTYMDIKQETDVTIKQENREPDAEIKDVVFTNELILENTEHETIPSIQSIQYELQISPVKEENDFLKVSVDSDLEVKEHTSKSVKTRVKTKIQAKRKKKTKATLDVISKDDLKLLSKKLDKKEKKILKEHKSILELRDRIVQLLDGGKLDLGENVVMTKDVFLGMFGKCDKSRLQIRGVLKKGPGDMAKVKKFLLYLLKRYNPEYESVFDIEYLTTRDMKLVEFESRKERKEYVMASFKCERCYKAFELQSLLDYHNKWHEASRPHACDICSMRFSARKHLNVHCRSSHYSVYRCKLCAIITYDFDAMVNHYHQHKGVRYTCDVCLSEYSSKSSLNTHRLMHATHACRQCARRFVSEQGLNNHTKLKHQDAELTDAPQRVSCDKCDATFESRDALRKHARHTHEIGKRLYKCLYTSCMELFNSAAELRAHAHGAGHVRRGQGRRGVREFRGKRMDRAPRVNVTGPDKPYRTCPICQEKVPNKNRTSLYSHHVTSHPTEPYASADARDSLCEHCGKSFVHESVYRDHLNTHSGVKPYSCRECGARFHMRRSLYMHRERHRPPRHQCKECGKMFLTAANLLTHRRTHSGDRNFKCDICFKGFLHSYALKEHIQGVHNQIRRVKKASQKKIH